MGVSSAYVILKDFPPRENLSLACSVHITSQEDLRIYSNQAAGGKWCSETLKNRLGKISKDEIFQGDVLSADLIANLICSQNIVEETPWRNDRFVKIKKFRGRLKNYIKRKIFLDKPVDRITKYNLAKPSEKMPGGISSEEVRGFLKKIGCENVTVYSPLNDVVVIE